MTADGRAGRPFTLRLEQPQEKILRRKLAELHALPWDQQPQSLFGYNGGRRRDSFGWFIIWAALEYSSGKTKNELPVTPKRKAKRAGKVKAKRAKVRK